MEFWIETESLLKEFGGVVAVRDLSLRVPKGAAFGFLGANGAGKTTVVDMLTTLSWPTAGRARVLGFDTVRDAMEVRRNIGVVSDTDRPPLGHWEPLQYVSFFAELYGVDSAEAQSRAREALAAMGLAKHLGRPIGSFSSGMRRKVDLVRALVHRPRILFLDEPTRQLDIVARSEFWRTLRAHHAAGTTIFLTSHDPAEVAAVCTHVGVLHEGRLLFQGELAEFTGGEPSAEAVRDSMEKFIRRRAEFSVVGSDRATGSPRA